MTYSCDRGRSDMKKVICAFAAFFLLFGCSKKNDSETIRLGGLFDFTGATHETSVPYADGIRNCIAYVNGAGGVNGRKISLIDRDSTYIVPRVTGVYESLVEKENVCAILGWGTGATEYLRPLVARDRIPFMSASYSKNLVNISEAPYNFLIGVTYSEQMKIMLRYVAEQTKNLHRRPRVAFIYNETEFGRSPVPAGREYAASHGIDVVAEEIVVLDAREAREQLLRIKNAKADYAVIQETTWAASVILSDARKMGLSTVFIGLNWCVDEKVIALSGASAEGFIGAIPFEFTDESLPGMREIMEYNRRNGVSIEGYILRYVQGWVTAKVMIEGIRRAGRDLSGPAIRSALESITDFDTGGITAPITFSPSSHKGCDRLKIGKVSGGRWKIISGYLSAD